MAIKRVLLSILLILSTVGWTYDGGWDAGKIVADAIRKSDTLPSTCSQGEIYQDNDATSGEQLYLCESEDTWVLQSPTTETITGVTGFQKVGTEVILDTITDNVGIGISSTNYKLHVSGDIYTDSSLYVDDYIYGNTTTGTLSFVANTAGGTDPDMVIKNDGNVGIGTTSPTEKLEVIGNTVLNIIPSGVGGCDANTAFLSHLDGADAATSATDENCNGGGAKTITFAGTGQLNTAQFKFATASFLGDGNSDYFTIADSANFTIGTGNYTIDFWVRFNAVQATSFYNQLTNDSNFTLFQYTGSNLQFYSVRSGNDTNITAAWSPSINTWYHVALERSASTTYAIYVNGTALSLSSNDTSLTNHTDLTSVVYVGHRQDNSGTAYLDGWIDEYRISNGVARYSGNFTPNTAEYDAESTTVSPKISMRDQGVDLWAIKNDGDDSDKFEILEDDTDVRFAIAAGGNVGIGSTNPAGLLDITGGDLLVGVAGDVLFVDQSTGNVGIGTATPVNKLHLDGAENYIRFTDPADTGSTTSDGSRIGLNGYQLFIDNKESSDIALKTAGTTRMTIGSGGNVGIADTTPDAALEIVDTGADILNISSTASGDGDYLTVDTSGNVGIGTTTPMSLLAIESDSGSTVPTLTISSSDNAVGDSQTLGSLTFRSNDASAYGDGIAAYVNAVDGLVGGNGQTTQLEFGARSSGLAEADATTKMVLTGTGNLGIGTTTPNGTLSVYKGSAGGVTPFSSADELVIEDGSTAGISILTPDASQSSIFFGSASDSIGSLIIWNHDSDLFALGTDNTDGEVAIRSGNNSEAMRIDSSGNVGIGNVSPDTLLDVEADTDPIITISSAGEGRLQLGYDSTADEAVVGARVASGGIVFKYDMDLGDPTSGTDAMIIDNSGNVGIGTTSPNATLNVHSGDGGAMIASANADDLVVENSTHGGISILVPNGGDSSLYFGSPSDTVGALVSYRLNNDLLKIGTAGAGGEVAFLSANQAEAMRIDSDGNVGIGDTTPDATLEIVDSGTDILNISSTASGDGDYVTVDTSGNVGIGTATPATPLDVYGITRVLSKAYSNPTTGKGLEIAYNDVNDYATLLSYDRDASSYKPLVLFGSSFGFDVNGSTDEVTIDSSGNVGIGTTAPTKKLSIADSCIQLKSPDASLSNCCVDNSDVFTCTGI